MKGTDKMGSQTNERSLSNVHQQLTDAPNLASQVLSRSAEKIIFAIRLQGLSKNFLEVGKAYSFMKYFL
jgi:hypothetical protein